MREKTEIYKAIKRAGGFAPLAERLGVTRQALYLWARRGAVDSKSVIQFHRLTGLPLNLCNPDLYPLGIGLALYEGGDECIGK